VDPRSTSDLPAPPGAQRARWPRPEPFAARLHFVPWSIRPVQAGTVRLFRRYFEQAPGWVLSGRAEIVEQLEAKRSLVSAHPFFVRAPLAVLNVIHRTILRAVWIPFLRWWVRTPPVVVIRPDYQSTPAHAG
jgi:hypothetical protein